MIHLCIYFGTKAESGEEPRRHTVRWMDDNHACKGTDSRGAMKAVSMRLNGAG